MVVNREIFNSISIFLFISLLLAICGGCGQKGVSGQVVDPEGNYIEGVLVKIEKSNFEAATDKEGKYIVDYAPGSFKIIFSKNNYSKYEMELNLSNKTLFPAETITLYPVRDEKELYSIKGKHYKRLSPKDEWEIMSKIKQLRSVSNGNIKLTKELLSSLFPVPIEQIDDKGLAHMNQEFKEREIIDIEKIVDISIYKGGIEVEVSATAKEKERLGKTEISMVKNDRSGENWFVKHVSGVR